MMNAKILLGFLGGAALASVGSYWLTHRPSGEPAVVAIAPSPAAIVKPEPPPLDVPPPLEPETPRPSVPPPPQKHLGKPVTRSFPKPLVRRLPAYVYRPQVVITTPAVPKQPPVVASAPPPVPAPAPPAVETQPPPVVQIKPPPPEPHTVTIRSGTLFRVRLGQAFSAQHNRPGDPFAATLDQELVVEGFVIAERGSEVEGRVLQAEEAGRTRGLSHLSLELLRIHTSDDQMLPIHTARFEQLGPAIENRISFRLDQPVTITEKLQP
jgi:hypothetical protein